MAATARSQLPPAPLRSILRHLSRSDEPFETIVMYQRVRNDGDIAGLDRFSFPPLLKAAARVSDLSVGMEIHGVAEKLGFGSDSFVETGLVGMYGACGKAVDARKVFDRMAKRDIVAWNTMIEGYCRNGLLDNAFELLEVMMRSDVKPDEMILCNVVSACGRAGNIHYGKAIHDFIIQSNTRLDDYLETALVSMYANCGSMDIAELLFRKMSVKNLIVSTSIVSGYLKVGRIEDARRVFDQVDAKDVVCWSVMILGYAESDRPQEALKLFEEMRVVGKRPDQVIVLSVISALSNLGALDQANQIEMYIKENGFEGALPINNALIDMYAKCGSLERAREVFVDMPYKNVISWTSMINAFAIHGDAFSALSFFNRMREENVEPNGVTFLGMLYACSHAGLVEEGKKIFESMTKDYNIAPKHEHYGSMVDLLGRANHLKEALELVESMPMPPNVIIWGSLMSASRIHGDIVLGEFAAKRVLELDPNHEGAHIFLSNICASQRRWDAVGNIRQIMDQKGVFKERGFSRIELNGEIHEFLVSDTRHKQSDEIYTKLDEVVGRLKLAGYVPDTRCVLVDLEEEEKKEVVLWHSEKLAVCYGLLNSEKGSCIRIIKNLRVCEDCHTFLKLVSKVYERDIVVRDRTRFHHYRAGLCSCNDYW